MSVLFILIGVSVLMSAGFTAACLVSIRSGQFDDLESPKWRIFFTDATESMPLNPGIPPEPPSRMDAHDPHQI
jgi:cbb3-type cytochrome oxidase maturation protein